MIEKKYIYIDNIQYYILSFNIFTSNKKKQNKKKLINHNGKTFLKNIYKLFTIQLSQICNLWIDVISKH